MYDGGTFERIGSSDTRLRHFTCTGTEHRLEGVEGDNSPVVTVHAATDFKVVEH